MIVALVLYVRSSSGPICCSGGEGSGCAASATTDRRREERTPRAWPSVVAVVPARDEADVIARERRLAAARRIIPAIFSVVLVDDQSTDGTADAAIDAARAAGAEERLRVIAGGRSPTGWTGKLWAMRQGLAAVDAGGAAPDFLLFTDADIAYAPHVARPRRRDRRSPAAAC